MGEYGLLRISEPEGTPVAFALTWVVGPDGADPPPAVPASCLTFNARPVHPAGRRSPRPSKARTPAAIIVNATQWRFKVRSSPWPQPISDSVLPPFRIHETGQNVIAPLVTDADIILGAPFDHKTQALKDTGAAMVVGQVVCHDAM
jgi:hypothetical protein